ncbi:MAG: TatD family hydrolase [Candidatus Dojkabacteria bacterium]|nr:MAG: TatD family hydrolase [Candidatus Dojkabacteria bacterium]
MIDSHAHISFDFPPSYTDAVIASFVKQGGKHIVDIVTEIKELQSTLDTFQRNPETMSYCIGIHPERAYADTSRSLSEQLKTLSVELAQMKELANNGLKGIGEAGFDIYRCEESQINKTIELQKELLDAHMELAEKFMLPIVIHARGRDISDMTMHEYTVEYFRKRGNKVPIYFHSFGGSKELMGKMLDIGGYIGINGIISYSGSTLLKEALQFVPADRYVLETDSPFLIPSNADRNLLQDKTKNEPLSVYWIAKIVAKITGKEFDQVITETTNNAKRLFSL